MTLWLYGVDDRRPISPHPRAAHVPVQAAPVVTAVCVVIGAVLAITALPRFQAPSVVARAYVQAALREDWRTSWELLCGRSRALSASYSEFAEMLAQSTADLRLPSDVDVDVVAISLDKGPTVPVWIVTVTATSDRGGFGGWSVKLPVARVEGSLRVCPIERPRP